MRIRNFFFLPALVAFFLPTAQAGLVQVLQPHTSYTTGTTLIPIVDSDGTDISGISDGNLTVTFSHIRQIQTIGSGWSTWGVPADTESSTPRVLIADDYNEALTSLTMTFSMPVFTFGFEAEPNPFDLRNITVEYFNGATSLGTISRDIHGQSGARLLAVSSDTQITSLTVSSDVDFAIAQLRYSEEVATPEPGASALLGCGLTVLLAARARMRRQS